MTNMYYLLLSDAYTIYLTFSGILISVITLLYSFINGKRSELELCAEASKSGLNDPIMRKRQSNLIQQIRKLSRINKNVFIVLLLSIAACIISWISLRFVSDKFHIGILYIIGGFTLLIGVVTFKMVHKLYLHYKNDITI